MAKRITRLAEYIDVFFLKVVVVLPDAYT